MLATQLRSYARRADGEFGPELMADDEARGLARTVGARAMVLLKNDEVGGAPVLPLAPDQVTSIALIGRLATAPNMGDHGSSDVRPPSHVTPLDGITAAFPHAQITLVADDDPAAAAQAARAAQVAIVVAGFDARDEGEYVDQIFLTRPDLVALYPPAPQGAPLPWLAEGAAGDAGNVVMTGGYGGDRTSLTLRPVDEEIIRAVAAANPRTVVAVVAAGAVLTETWRHQVPGIVLMWYAGMEGGHALADVLTGAHNPSGRLPFSIPTSADHLAPYERDATAITYGRLHGQRLLDELGVAPAFPHGYGLSYTTYSIDDATIGAADEHGASLAVQVTNTGDRDGHHVVQVYGRPAEGDYAGELMLVGFAGVDVPARASAGVEVLVSFLPLAQWDPTVKRRVLPPTTGIALEVGSHAHDPDAIVVRLPA
jgi:beta-glucosidase